MMFRDDPDDFSARLEVARQRLAAKREAEAEARRQKEEAEAADEARLQDLLQRASQSLAPLALMADGRGVRPRNVFLVSPRNGSRFSWAEVCSVADAEQRLGEIMETADFAAHAERVLAEHQAAEEKSLAAGAAAPVARPHRALLPVLAWVPLTVGFVLWSCEAAVPAALPPLLCLLTSGLIWLCKLWPRPGTR